MSSGAWHYIASDASAHTTFFERFNRRLRAEFLNETRFRLLAHARETRSALVIDHGTFKPHGWLDNNQPPTTSANPDAPCPCRERK